MIGLILTIIASCALLAAVYQGGVRRGARIAREEMDRRGFFSLN